MITKKQKRVLDLIRRYHEKHGYAPSFEELRKRLKVASVSTVSAYIQKLTKNGFLEKEKNQPRGIRPIERSETIRLPITGTVSAGWPTAVLEQQRSLFINPLEETEEKSILGVKGLPINQIILGDALEGLKQLPSESCDVIIADPPYNIGKNFGNNIDRRELQEYVRWSAQWIQECIRILKPRGTMFIYGFSEILAYLSVEIPLPKRWLIWHYTNKNVASLQFWQRSHESIICTWKGDPIFNRDAVREPYTEGFLNGAAGKVRKATAGRFSKGEKETIYQAHENGALPRDVIKIPALAGGAGMNERWFICHTCNGSVCAPRELKKHEKHEIEKHPTQKPLELCKKLIQSAMPNQAGTVLVPFVGTGSECAAAKQLKQQYIGFELNPAYVKLANTYINAIQE